MATYALKGGDGLTKALEAIAKRMGGGQVKVGFMEGATYPDSTPVAAVAFWNEYGTVGQPPRPFFRNMIAEESASWPGKMAAAAKATNYDGQKVLGLMGEDIAGALQQSVNDFESPALADSTIEAKGFAKPLIDTGDMLRAISYQVDDGDIVKAT